MAKRQSIKWYLVNFPVYEVDELTLNDGSLSCPECNDPDPVEIMQPLVQFGLFEDVHWEFIMCKNCDTTYSVRSKVILEGGIPFETMLDEYIKSRPDYIPF